MIAKILLGGKSARIATRQRMNPTVSMKAFIESLPKLDRICENFKRSLAESDGILQLDQQGFNENIPGSIAEMIVLRKHLFLSFV